MIGVIFRGMHATPEQYDSIRDALETHITPPPGRLWHAAGIDDGLYVIEVWESEEAAEAFFDEKLSAAMREFNMVAERQTFPIIGTIQP